MSAALRIVEMPIANAYRIYPQLHHDNRGHFFEAFRADALSEAIGYPFLVNQASYAGNGRGVLRGIHGTSLPPGQAKLVTCVRGAVLNAVVDLRVGSPTFGRFETTLLEEDNGTQVYLADGLGHAFYSLTEGACVHYLQSEAYVPGTMIEVNALDQELGIRWNLAGDPVRSEKDAGAMSLEAALKADALPGYAECLAHYAALAAHS